jgi:hypothetical protein
LLFAPPPPPPVDVIVENEEGDPLTPLPSCGVQPGDGPGPAAPPPPTTTGKFMYQILRNVSFVPPGKDVL